MLKEPCICVSIVILIHVNLFLTLVFEYQKRNPFIIDRMLEPLDALTTIITQGCL
jgi:hypothetical protein